LAESDIIPRLSKGTGLSLAAPCEIEVAQQSRYGRITQVKVTDGTGKTVTLAGEKFRRIIGSRDMPSTRCRLRKEGSDYVFFDGYGLGHGVGMCQYGAEGLARKGYTAVEILNYYYPSSRLVRAY
jgi:stage II sporulation protein D